MPLGKSLPTPCNVIIIYSVDTGTIMKLKTDQRAVFFFRKLSSSNGFDEYQTSRQHATIRKNGIVLFIGINNTNADAENNSYYN